MTDSPIFLRFAELLLATESRRASARTLDAMDATRLPVRNALATTVAARGHDLIAPLAVWSILIAGALVWGLQLRDAHPEIKLNAPPLFGRFDLHLDGRLLPPLVLAVAAVVLAPRIARRASWRTLLLVAMGAAIAWAAALALSGGVDSLKTPLLDRHDYLEVATSIDSPGAFLESFTADITRFPVHVQGHPPGMVLLLWGLGRLGFGGAGPAAALVIIAGASTVPAALISVRELVGERAARAASPFLVFVPAALWIATSADALYAGVSAWAVALLVLASGRGGSRSVTLALAGGVLFGTALFLTYGAAPLALVAVSACVIRHRLEPLVWGSVGILTVVTVFGAAGFLWPEGLGATLDAYAGGVSAHRPLAYFAVANLAAFAVALGPATALGLAALRDKRLWLVVGAVLVAVAAADLSGWSKGEVERIWLPFVPWVVISTCALRAQLSRPALALQTMTAIAVQVGVLTPW